MKNGKKHIKLDVNYQIAQDGKSKSKRDVPIITSKYNNSSELCWRGCGYIGNLRLASFTDKMFKKRLNRCWDLMLC